jgi:hypothetical protein
MSPAIFTALALAAAGAHHSRDPFDCSGVQHYPFSLAIVTLQNLGRLDDSDVDYERSKSEVIATRRLKPNLERQVLLLNIRTKTNKIIRAMVINYASREECSADGDTQIYEITELH